jgi:putative ABC transport system substrate-binding protein
MDRRSFMRLSAASLLGAPIRIHAQTPARTQGRVWRIGFLGANTPATAGHLTTAFLGRMAELGWAEGRTFVVVYRWAAGQNERFRALAAELVAENVDIIVTSGTAPSVAARNVTSTIPIVMASSGDLAHSGLVKSFARPGGNVTGLTFVPEDSVGKRLDLLVRAVPRLREIVVLFNPAANPGEVEACRAAAPGLGLTAHPIEFRELQDLARIAAMPNRHAIGGMYVSSDPLVFTNRVRIAEHAIRERLPTVHRLKEYAVDGGLISYGPSFPEFFRRAAEYVDGILKGGKPAEMPIEQPTRFELVINLRVAKALGIAMPQELLLQASELIQ